MSAAGDDEDEVFLDCGASPELRRSTRTSARKRSSTGGLLLSKPKKREKMMIPSPTTNSSPAAAADTPRAVPASVPVAGNGAVAAPAAAAAVTPVAGTQVPPQDPILASMGAMLAGMESRLSTATTNLQATVAVQIDGALTAIGDLGKRVDRNEKRLENMMNDIDEKIATGLEKMAPSLPGSAGHWSGPPPKPANLGWGGDDDFDQDNDCQARTYASILSSVPASIPAVDKKEESYWKCRHMLRLRPVGAGDKHEATIKFMKEYLKLEDSFIAGMGVADMERIPYGPKSKFREEMLVHFTTVEARDIVKGAASNLDGCGPEYGIRLEVPNHLKANMKALQQVSYDIRQGHSGSCRNILYDDETLDLVLDFCLQEGGNWRRLTSAQARSRVRKSGSRGCSRVQDDELNEILWRDTDE